MIDTRLFALIAVLILAPVLLSRNVARIIASALLAHADGIDAYRRRASERAEHWYGQAVGREKPALVQLDRRAIGE
jgi:hypothetical protein